MRHPPHLRLARAISRFASERPQIAQPTLEFFGLSFRAHLESSYIRAAKLTDRGPRSATLDSLLREVLKNAGKFKFASAAEVRQRVTVWRDRVNKVNDEIKKLRGLRNDLIAHWDSKVILDPTETNQRVGVTFDEIDRILDAAYEVVSNVIKCITMQFMWTSS